MDGDRDLAAEDPNDEQPPTVSTFQPEVDEVQSPSRLLATHPADDTPQIPSTTSNGTALGYLGGSGLLTLFEPDYRGIARNDRQTDSIQPSSEDDLPPLELQQSFVETYFEYCWPWCPVLDKGTFWNEYSETVPPLLTNALALLGSQVRPPIMQHAKAADYYKRAKMQFYMDEESNPLVCLQSIILFYWWAPRG
jgi:hypothetical protein